MYRITRSMNWVQNRLRGFAENPNAPVQLESAERFLLTFALMEKLIRRTLTELIQIREGALTADQIAKRQRRITWGNIDRTWRVNDPNQCLLSAVSGHPKPASDGHLKTSHLDEVVHRVGYLLKGGLSRDGEPDQDGKKCFNHRALRTRLVPAADCA